MRTGKMVRREQRTEEFVRRILSEERWSSCLPLHLIVAWSLFLVQSLCVICLSPHRLVIICSPPHRLLASSSSAHLLIICLPHSRLLASSSHLIICPSHCQKAESHRILRLYCTLTVTVPVTKLFKNPFYFIFPT